MHDIVVYVDSARLTAAALCANTRTNQQVRTPSALIACPQLEDLNKEPEPTATLPAPGGAANLALALALAMAMALTAAARQAKQQGNPSCLALTAATATSSPTADAVPITADACKRDGAARGAATGGNADTSQLAAQGRGDQYGQDDERAGKAAGTLVVSVLADGGGVGRSLASYIAMVR